MELFSLRLGGRNVMEVAAKVSDEIVRLRAEVERLRGIIKAAEVAIARDDDVNGAMRWLFSADGPHKDDTSEQREPPRSFVEAKAERDAGWPGLGDEQS